MEIVKAKLQDSAKLAQMNYWLIRDEGHRNPMNQAQLNRRMRNWLKSDYHACLFKEQSKIIGYCLYRKEEGATYIRQFYIDRVFRRQGWGRMAFDLLLQGVWKKTFRLRLDVLTGNKNGIGFWRNAGFKDYCLTMERKTN